MDKRVLEARLDSLRQQMEQLAYQKYRLGEKLTQVQGNIDATYGAIQFGENLLEGMGDDDKAGNSNPDQ